MHWNYRRVELPEANAGYPWIEIREVYYTDEGEPYGHADVGPIGGCDDMELTDVMGMLRRAMDTPVLTTDDFKNGNEFQMEKNDDINQ